MILYFQQRRLLLYQSREIRLRLHGLRFDFVDLHVKLWDWRQERSGHHLPYQGDCERDVTLSELVDEFRLSASRHVKLCDVWFQGSEFDDGRRKFATSVAPYCYGKMKLMDTLGVSSEIKPRGAVLEAIVTKHISWPKFAVLENTTAIHLCRDV